MSTSTVAYTSERPSAAATMRDIAAFSAAQRRTAEGLARHDPDYGLRVCTCLCRRCLPTKDDHGGCVAGGCVREFISHDAAAALYAGFGIAYDSRTRKFT